MEGRLFTPWTVGVSIGAHVLFFLVLIASPLGRPVRSLTLGRTITIRVAPGLPGRKSAPKAAPKPAAKPAAETKKLPLPVAPKQKPPSKSEKPAALPAPAPAAESPEPDSGPPVDGHGPAAAGTTVQGLDAAYFPFDYYVTQFLSRLSANWYKPAAPAGTSCVVRFTITKSGRISDAEVQTPSPYPAFDRAALRAVLSSNPLPPLPFEFNEEKLGVHLRFE
jgi:TonB family protein